MERPKRIVELKPTHGPSVSPIESDGKTIIVPKSGTLPPVCIITAETMSCEEAIYELTYLPIPVRQNGVPCSTLGTSHVVSSKASVRLPYRQGAQRVRLIKNVGFFSFFLLPTVGLVYWTASLPNKEGPVWAMLIGFVAFFAGVVRSHRQSLSAELLRDGRVKIIGIRPTVVQAMMDWQSRRE